MYYEYDFGGLGVIGILITIAIIYISICITIAPLLIWRNSNRTNRLLTLIAFQLGIPSNKIQDIYLLGGADFNEIITAMSDSKPEVINKNGVIYENQNLINSNLTSIKNMFPEFEWIVPSPYKFYTLVKNGSEYSIVEIGGFKPNVISSGKLEYMPKLKKWMDDYLKRDT